MSDTLYPIFYGTRLVTFDVLRNTFEPRMHPEAARRAFNFILYKEGFFGVGGGYRALGTQPDRPGFAQEGRSFHQPQNFPSGQFYTAWDTVVRNPGGVHRAPRWSEVPIKGSQQAKDFGYHMNVGTPPRGEPWHGQPIELDGWWTWANAGRKDLQSNYPIKLIASNGEVLASPVKPYVPPKPPERPTISNPSKKEITLNVNSRYLEVGVNGSDVKFYQRLLNDIGGQGLTVDGIYGPKTKTAVTNWQIFFGLFRDGELGPVTQTSVIEISLKVS